MADQAADEAAVREAMKQIEACYNAHDAKACAALMDEDFQNWEGTVRGRADAEKNFFASQFEQSKDLEAKILEVIGVVFVTPEVAIHKFRYEVSNLLDADGKPLPPERALGASVFIKKGGKWLRAALFTRPIEE